jgi:hypothetical protein
MPTYHGKIQAVGAAGPINVAIGKTGRITGNLKIGARPRMALTGFQGEKTGETTFTARGENTRTDDPLCPPGEICTMHLAVTVNGYITADGEHVAGTILAVLNGAPQPEWTFQAGAPGTEELELVKTATGEVTYQEPEEKSLWRKIPTALKATLGVTAATLAGLLIYRQTQG